MDAPTTRPRPLDVRRTLVPEFLGTFALVFAGCGAIAIDAARDGAIGHVGIALTFGLVVMAMIYTFGESSGAHLNPAVTLGFWAAGRLPGRHVLPYGVAQSAGAIAASAALCALLPERTTVGETLPSGSVVQALGFELLLTAVLMMVILRVSTGSREVGVMAGAAIGATIAFEALFAGPVSGASMNPARSLGPALFAADPAALAGLWVYVAAPIAGALVAVFACRLVPYPGCCDGREVAAPSERSAVT